MSEKNRQLTDSLHLMRSEISMASGGGFKKFSLLSTAGNGVRVTLSFLATALASRWLGADDFGEASLIMGYCTIAHYFLLLGFDWTLSYLVPQLISAGKPHHANKMFGFFFFASLFMGLALLTGLVASLQLGLHGPLKTESQQWAMILIFVATIFNVLHTIISGYLRGRMHFVPAVFKDQILVAASFLVGILFFVGFQKGQVVGYAWAFLFSGLVSLIYGGFALVKARADTPFSPHFAAPNSTEIKSWVMFSIPNWFISLLDTLLASSLVLFAGFYLTSAEVGSASLALRITYFGQFLFVGLSPIFTPYLSELQFGGKREESKKLIQLVNVVSLKWSILFGGFIWVVTPALPKIFGPSYLIEYSTISWMMLGQILVSVCGFARVALPILGLNRWNIFNYVMAILTSFFAMSILAKPYGVIGAAASFGLAYAVVSLLSAWAFYAKLKISLLSARDLPSLLVFSVAIFTVSLVTHQWVESPMILLALGLGIMVFGLGLLLLQQGEFFLRQMKKKAQQ